MKRRSAIAWLAGLSQPAAWAQPAPRGELAGTAFAHTEASLRESLQRAWVVLPAAATGGAPWAGAWREIPATQGARVPVVVLLHGSSGLGLKAIGEWQLWLASLGVASVAPDSFALPGRVTYKSPIAREDYERIHALRQSEVAPVLGGLRAQTWADLQRLVLAGTSEGAVPVARWRGDEFAARMLYAWSCEDNYFVQAHASALPAGRPVLNVISSTDPFFSPANTWLGNAAAQGHCGAVLKDNPQSAVVLVPGAPHTLLNLPAARHATEGFLRSALRL